MATSIFLLPRDEGLDPLSRTSILEWVDRSGPHRQSSKKPGACAQNLATLIQRLWPGIDEIPGARAITLSAPDAPFSVSLGEDRATVSMPEEPSPHERRSVDTIVRAISQQSGWIAYDPQQQDVVAGIDWHCPACKRWLPVRTSCPSCARTPSATSLTWAEPTPVLPMPRYGSLELTPLLAYYGIPASALTKETLRPIEIELARVASEVLGGKTVLDVSIDPPFKIDLGLGEDSDEVVPPRLFAELAPVGLGVWQCLKVVETVVDPEREIAQSIASAELGEVEVDEDLLFVLAISPVDDKEQAEAEGLRQDFLPHSPWQPGLARPLWAALRPMLQGMAPRLS